MHIYIWVCLFIHTSETGAKQTSVSYPFQVPVSYPFQAPVSYPFHVHLNLGCKTCVSERVFTEVDSYLMGGSNVD